MMSSNEERIAINTIRKTIPRPALYEQLAEECSELAQASLKMARILRGENKTPVTIDEARENIKEEYTDIILCAETLGIVPSGDIMTSKIRRWVARNTAVDIKEGA